MRVAMDKDEDFQDCMDLSKKLVTDPKQILWNAIVSRKQKKIKNNNNAQSKQPKKGYLSCLMTGLILAVLACSSLIWNPSDILLNQRLTMVPGLPPFEWWKEPPDEVLLSLYVFNITNGPRFIEGLDDKLHLQEIGPIIYREKLTHTNIEFHQNDTMSYTATRQPVFLPEMNTVDLDAMITVPNFAVLGIASYLWEAAWPMKMGFQVLVSRERSQPLVTTSIRDYMWNFSDPVFVRARSILPVLVPTVNAGILHQIYENFVDNVTVKIGKKWGNSKFFTVDMYNGRAGLGVWRNETCDSVQGSSEGVSYHQKVTRNDTLWYLRKTFCRIAPLYYTGEREFFGLNTYKFELAENTFHRPADGNDCYLRPGVPTLPDGLSDVSPCYYKFPVASSFPHFMHSDPKITEKLEGLKPDHDKHGSYIYVEPNTGISFNQAARSQCNLIIRNFTNGFHRLKRFSGMVLPMFWAEYMQVGLPWKIKGLIYFLVKLPEAQFPLCILLLVVSIFCLNIARRRYKSRKVPRKQVAYSFLNPLQRTDKQITPLVK